MEKKWFTVWEANALLPFLYEEVVRLKELKNAFDEKIEELRRMKQLQLLGDPLLRAKEAIFQLECEIEFLQIEANTVAAGLKAQGVELRDIDEGLIDFPATLNGEEVLLCWKLGEPKVAHYHSMEDGFAGRRPIELDR